MTTRAVGPWLYFLTCGLFPFGLWLFGSSDAIRFDSFYSSVTTLGKFAGILGIHFFAGNLILSGKYRFVDRYFGGLDQAYNFHHRRGLDTLALLCLHPLLFALGSSSVASALVFLFLPASTAVNFGKIALAGLITVIALTIFAGKKFRYEQLKFIHAFTGLFFIVGLSHLLLIPSDIASNMPLRWYAIALSSLAIASFAYRTLFNSHLVKRILYKITEVRKFGTVTEVTMAPESGASMHFSPGQFNLWRFRQDGFPLEEHPFTISASALAGTLRISAKNLGDFTANMGNLKIGTTAEVRGPFGQFSYEETSVKNHLWIAGGIGITPFLSMLRTLDDKMKKGDKPDMDVVLVWSTNIKEEMVFREEIATIAGRLGFRFMPWVSSEKGLLTVERIGTLTDMTEREIFLCGPLGMTTSLKKALVGSSIPSERIHVEIFKLL